MKYEDIITREYPNIVKQATLFATEVVTGDGAYSTKEANQFAVEMLTMGWMYAQTWFPEWEADLVRQHARENVGLHAQDIALQAASDATGEGENSGFDDAFEAATFLIDVSGYTESAALAQAAKEEGIHSPERLKRFMLWAEDVRKLANYRSALEMANELMEMAEGLEIGSALKQAASDYNIPDGDEMKKFMEWAEGQLSDQI
jgi:hypothetical protein